MEKQNVSTWKANLNWGLILGFVLVIYTAILYFADQTFNKGLGSVSYLFMIAGIFFGIKAYRDNFLGGFISYGKAVGAGVIISLYSGILGAIFTILLYTAIDPDLVQKLYSITEQGMLDKGMAEEQIEVAMEVSKKFMSPYFMAVWVIVGSVFVGLIISLIEAIFLKKEGDPVVSEAEKTEE